VSKKYDIVAKVGTYKTKQGEDKAIWRTVGAVVEGDKGPFIVIDRAFNPAALPDAKGDGKAYLSLFVPEAKGTKIAGDDDVPRRSADPDDRIPF
jgi:hypothetical protein